MPLTVALNSALSSLRTIQTQMGVAASNIANADTQGYSRKYASQTTVVANGQGVGTVVEAITSKVDQNLLRDIAKAVSENEGASVTDDYLQQLQQAMGNLSSDDSGGTSLSSLLSDLQTSLESLAATPESDSLKSQLADSLDQVAAQLRDLSAQTQGLRADADQQISDTVADVNSGLQTIASLNEDIRRAAARGQSTADLEDQRMTALQGVAKALNVTYFIADNGDMRVYTAGNQPLLDSQVHELSHSSATTMSSATAYSAGSGAIDGIMVDGTDITGALGTGSLGALVELRDKTLPDVQAELDQLAVGLRDSQNAIHNQGSASPPPNSLTGTASTAATDSLGGSGMVRIAVTAADGNVTAFGDLDLSSYATVGDLVGALDAIAGLSATLDTDGHLTLIADDATGGVAINEMTSSIGGKGLSSFFGLNDLLTGTGAENIALRADLAAAAGAIATGKLDSSAGLTVGSKAVTSGDASVAQSLASALESHSFAAAGALDDKQTSFSGYAASIISLTAQKTETATSAASARSTTLTALTDSFQSKSGVNVDEETARLNDLQNAYSASAQVITTLNKMFESLLDAVS